MFLSHDTPYPVHVQAEHHNTGGPAGRSHDVATPGAGRTSRGVAKDARQYVTKGSRKGHIFLVGSGTEHTMMHKAFAWSLTRRQRIPLVIV